METDNHLLSRYHHHGDAEAFQRLVEAHAGMVHATASRVTRDASLAQDVAQETFLALARNSGAAIQSVGAWLHHVAWHKACDLVRGESRRHGYEAAAVAAGQLHEAPAEAQWAELEPLLDETLEELPAETRELLIERFLEGRTQQEVARRRGVSQSTVSRLMTNAIGDLRSRLKAKGILCGSGLVVLLSTHGSRAAPAALTASLGKLALSGAGVSISTLTLTNLIITILMKTQISKVTLAGVAILFVSAASYDLASADPWLLGLFGDNNGSSKRVAPSLKSKSDEAKGGTAAAAVQVSKSPSKSQPPVGSGPSGAMPASGDTAEMRLAKLAQLNTQADFKAMMLKLYAMGDARYVSSELKRLMGIDLDERVVTAFMRSPMHLEMGVLTHLARKHPQEALAWMAMLDETSHIMTGVMCRSIFKDHPEITAESVMANLPAGPGRDQVLSLLRAQQDPVAEAQRLLSTVSDHAARLDQLWKLAELWPKGRADEAMAWARANLSGRELTTFLPRVAHHLSTDSHDAVLALMAQTSDPDLLAAILIESLHGLVQEGKRMADVVPVIGRLEGKQRAYAIAELSRRWVRVDQEGLMQWINSLESAADFEAALPLTLAQLTPENYAKAMNTLMTQLDGTLDAALIKAAMPDFAGATGTTMDIVQRLTQLPQYQSIGSGKGGNQELLWQAVNKTAEGWVKRHGAKAQQGAQWIDSLTFNSAADKAIVAGHLYQQWKISDPTGAALWAASAGVKVP
jgi:RNA polymerase sigma factor (sigma-70 family)